MAFSWADIDAASAKPNGDRAFGDQIGQGQFLRTDPGADIAMRDYNRADSLKYLRSPSET